MAAPPPSWLSTLARWLGRANPAALPVPDGRTFILWEPSSRSHGEVLPGYAHYLLDLGYRVVVLVTPARLDEGLFDRFRHPDLSLVPMASRKVRRLLGSGYAAPAAGLMITTAGKLTDDGDYRQAAKDLLGSGAPDRVLQVVHDARPAIAAGKWAPSFITLRDLEDPDHPSAVVNPHRFGTVEATGRNARTVFLMVGAARAKRRNQNLVYDALEALLARGITDFELRLVGKKDKAAIPAALRDHVVKLGRVSFSDLYREVETCDFLLTAFQPDNPLHDFYRTTGTSGAFQLSYGFAKPCVVEQSFVGGTALCDRNAVVYSGDAGMVRALETCARMSEADYETMQTALQDAAERLWLSSRDRLERLIDG